MRLIRFRQFNAASPSSYSYPVLEDGIWNGEEYK